MKLFYGKAKDRADVASDSPAEASLESALEIFRVLEPGKGFVGIALTERHVLQLLVDKRGDVRIELLDTAIPALDACLADRAFAESLLRAAAEGHDVFQIARDGGHNWDHLDLGA